MTNSESDSDEYSPVCSEADPTEFAGTEDNDIEMNVHMENVCEVEELEDDDITICK